MRKSKIMYSCGVILSILVIIAVLMFLGFKKKTNVKSDTIAEITSEKNNENAEMASVIEDKSIQEVKEEKITKEEIPKVEEKTKEEEKKVDSTEKNIEKQEIVNNTPTFAMPVEGEIIRNYAKDKLVYSDTLKEWVTHLGIDIKAAKTSVVKASSAGKVVSIKNDPRFGLSIAIQHSDGYSTIYSNLLTAEFVTIGEQIDKGETIGTVGNTAAFEIMDEPHLHFEIMKDGVQIDPNMYL